MKTDRFVKFLLSVIALSLMVLVGEGWNKHTDAVQAAAIPQWEYGTFIIGYDWHGSTPAVNSMMFNGGNVTGVAPAQEFNVLGKQGWEFVASCPEALTATPAGATSKVSLSSSLNSSPVFPASRTSRAPQ